MSKDKPTVYLDTNILSVLHYRGGIVTSLAWQIVTRDWWAHERGFFKIFASKIVEDELAAGCYSEQYDALNEVRKLPYLSYVKDVHSGARAYLDAQLVPQAKQGDALQLAFATVHKMDYLLTWNHAHLANVETQRKLHLMNQKWGWRTPLIVSPDTIPKVVLGQSIRRKDKNEFA